MKPNKLIVQGTYGELYRLHRRGEPPVCAPAKPVCLWDDTAHEFIIRLKVDHADWLKILHEMNATSANSNTSLYYSQHDIARLAHGRHRAITFYRFTSHIDFSATTNPFPIIKAPQGLEYHFIPTSILLRSDPDPADVIFFRPGEGQQAHQFLETLELTDEQLATMIPGLSLRAWPTRADRIDRLVTALARGEIAVVKIYDSTTPPPKRKGPEDLPVEEYTPKPYTLGPHEEPGYVPKENPHSGLHNQEALTPDFNTSAESFNTTRQVDMDDLSEVDSTAALALKDQGWDAKKIKQVLKSGDDFMETPYQTGDKIYGFNTAGRARKLDNSAYLLDEVGMEEVKSKYFKQGHWDKEGVKDYLALPCFNAANQIDVMEVTKPTTGIQSTIGKATELLRYDGADGYTTGTLGKIMGGGGTQVTLDTSALKLLPGK